MAEAVGSGCDEARRNEARGKEEEEEEIYSFLNAFVEN